MINEMVKETGISNFNPDKILTELQKKIQGKGISLEEGQEFSRELIFPLIDEAFPKPVVGNSLISLSDAKSKIAKLG